MWKQTGDHIDLRAHPPRPSLLYKQLPEHFRVVRKRKIEGSIREKGKSEAEG